MAWQTIKESLQVKLPQGIFKVWIDPIRFLKREDGQVTLGCPNTFFISWVKENYLNLLIEEWKRVDAEVSQVHLAVAPSSPASGEGPSPRQRPLAGPEGKPLYPFFNRRFTFDQFVAWNGNQYAYSAAWSLATEKSSYNNTLYLCSDTGLGKSHLTQAIGLQVNQAHPQVKILYITAEDFTNEIISSMKHRRMDLFCDRFRRHCDLLLLEEVHFLGGKERSQEQLARVLDILAQENKKVILTSPFLPKDLPRMNRGLRSRLGAGVIGFMEPPDLETRVKILDRKAKNRGMNLNTEVLEFLADQPARDIRILESCLIGLEGKARLLNQPIDLDLAKTVVEERMEARNLPDITSIQAQVCQIYQLSLEELCSRSRVGKVALPRSIGIYLCRKYTKESLVAIGKAFNRDHATVLYTLQRMDERVRQDREIKNQTEFISGKLEKQFSLKNDFRV